MKVDAIILHFGKINNTISCLKNLKKVEGIGDIYVVNNTPKEISSNLAEYSVIILNPEKNIGFAQGVNMGIKESLRKRSSAVLLLNNDATVKQDFLKPLIDEIEKERIGIVAPVIEFSSSSGLVYDHGGKINNRTGSTTHDNRKAISKKKYIQPDFVSGCCMLIKAEPIKKVGLFDEQFFMYYEDVDLCLRMKKAKYKIRVIPASLVHHDLTSHKSDKTIEQILKSSRKFYQKYHVKFQLGKITILRQSFIFAVKKPSSALKILKYSL